jgi:hypothetical protein
MIIENGVGDRSKAKVDSDNRLYTFAKTASQIAVISEELGDAYDFSTGDFVSITTVDTETGVFYLKNTSTTANVHIHSLRTCANQIHKVKLYKNPTGGTLITNETAGAKTNLNFNSRNVAEATVYMGTDGATVSGGTIMTQHINHVGHSTGLFDDAFIIGPQDSIAITFEMAIAGDCCVRVVAYFE